MPASAEESKKWAEYLAAQLTGFGGVTREDVGKVGSTADQSGEGTGWLRAKIVKKYDTRSSDNTAPGPLERVIRFYDFNHNTHKASGHFEVTLSVPWNEGGNDFSDTGKASAFDWGYHDALFELSKKYTSAGYQHPYTGVPQIAPADVVDLTTLVTTARSFDAVLAFFTEYGAELEKWVKDLGGEEAAWKGSAADVFRTLVDGIAYGYKDLKKDLTPFSGTPVSLNFGEQYTATSSIGQEIARCAKAIHDAATALAGAWDTWLNASSPTGGTGEQASKTYLPTYHLNVEVDIVAKYLNEYNIAKVSATDFSLGEGFSIYHPAYGDLTQEEAWRNVARAAYKKWVATVVATVDPVAFTQTQLLNEAFLNLASATGNLSFSTGFTDLKAKFVEESTKQKQEEMEKEKKETEEEQNKTKEEMEKELKGGGDGDKPPTLGPNGADGGLGGDGLGGQKPPGLDTGDKNAGTPPPLLDPNGANGGIGGVGGPKDVVRTPDGSTIVRNPDGSYTTTYPDGRKETTPPGVTPPLLGGNPIGGIPTKPVALKTVKGPDGSTTSYNQDGSRTTTHKDGTTTTVSRDGTTTTVNPDGSTTVLHKDGSQTTTYQDGTRTTIRPDGSSVTQYKDGSVQSRAADGTLTTTDAEGNKKVTHPQPGQTVHNPDRSTTTFGKDGSTTTVHPNGTKTTVSPNGTVTTVDPDGTKTVSQLGRNTSTIEYADGSVSKVDKDGTVVTTYKDGSSTRLAADGTYTTTEADGQKKTEHLNPLGGNAGAETKHNPDGSTTTRYPDGTVDQKLKDGGHKITYPDGRTVTTDADGRTLSVSGGPGAAHRTDGGSRWNNTDYYDYPDTKKNGGGLTGGGYGGYGGGSGGYGTGGGSKLPLLSNNPLGGGFGLGGGLGSAGAGGAGATGAERLRSGAVGEATAGRARAAQLAAEETAAMRRPATTSGGMPMMPPMGGGGGMGGGQSTQSDERERATWISEDEDVWGTDEGGVVGVIGR